MGCCSSSNTVAHSQSPTHGPIPNKNHTLSQNLTTAQLQQHHEINDKNEIPISQSFINNGSIVKEVMRLEQNNHNHNNHSNNLIETKSNENSEDLEVITNNINHNNNNNDDDDGSFAEFPNVNIKKIKRDFQTSSFDEDNDIYNHNDDDIYNEYNQDHPFGLIQTENIETENIIKDVDKKKEKDDEEEEEEQDSQESEQDIMENLQEFYAENLKQHGFDADKFRNANVSIDKSSLQNNNNSNNKINKRTASADLSSFASSQLSSKSDVVDINNHNKDKNNEDEYDDDLMFKELSRPNSMYPQYDDENNDNMNEIDNNEQSIQRCVYQVKNQVTGVMDDEDEELMDAILSLDLDD